MDSSSFPGDNNNDKETQTPEKEDEVNNRGKRKDVSGTSGASSRPAKAQKDKNAQKKVMNTRSSVWNDFTRTKEDHNTCFCNHCKRSFGCNTKSGTSHLNYHLRICLELKKSVEQQSPGTTVITNTGHLAAAKVYEPVFIEASNEMLVIGELPLSFIESAAWRHFCNCVNL